jgi:DNA helicase HerA-like ATPase
VRTLALGRWTRFPEKGAAAGAPKPFGLPPHHLVTHAAIVGMTGSGKTGLLFVLVEEALRSRVPALLIDLKGDLPNLLLSLPMASAEAFVPWIDSNAPHHHGRPAAEVAAGLAAERDAGLARSGLSGADVEAWRAGTRVRVLTPGSTAGEPIHLLSALERRSPLWDTDLELAREALASALSLVLRLVGRDPDPTRSRDHVLLAVLAERRLLAGAGGPGGAARRPGRAADRGGGGARARRLLCRRSAPSWRPRSTRCWRRRRWRPGGRGPRWTWAPG